MRPPARSTAIAGSIDSDVLEPEPTGSARLHWAPPSSEDEKKSPLLNPPHRLPPMLPSSTR